MIFSYLNKQMFNPAKRKFTFLCCSLFLFASCLKEVKIVEIGDISGTATICMLDTDLEYSLATKPDDRYYVLWTVPEQAQIISGQGESTITVNFGRKEGSVCAQLFTDGEVASKVQCFDVTFGVSDTWCRDVDMPGSIKRANQASFVLNDKAYIVMGSSGPGDFCKEVWQFDPVTHQWLKKKDFPGPFRIGAASFSLNNKGYVCSGENSLSGPQQKFYNDLWEYNPLTDTWTEKDTLPGSVRQYAFAFTIGNKAYVGNGKSGPTGLLSDFYEYNSVAGVWIQKGNTPFYKVAPATFSINNEGYVCAGSGSGDQNSASLFKYNPADDSWLEMTPLPAPVRIQTAGFSIDNSGYVCGGMNGGDIFNDLWEFNSISSEWTQRASFISPRFYHLGFAIKNKGYIVGGDNSAPGFLNDMWVYTP
jgi:N-acetylneuraminic acid mutarotase